MILNGKARIEFKKWLENRYNLHFTEWSDFNTTCRNALIIEWFDSVGIYIGIEFYGSPEVEIKYESIVLTKGYDWYLQNQFSKIYLTRQEATEKAIIKANKLYNNL